MKKKKKQINFGRSFVTTLIAIVTKSRGFIIGGIINWKMGRNMMSNSHPAGTILLDAMLLVQWVCQYKQL